MSEFTRNFLEEDGQPLVGVTSCLCYMLCSQDTAIASLCALTTKAF